MKYSKSQARICETFNNNWGLNLGTRYARVELHLFYSTWDMRTIWGNWVLILQIMSRKTWKVIQNLEALLDWQSYLGIEFDLFFGILGIMTLWGRLGPNTLDHWLGNRKSNSKSSVLYFTSNKAILKCHGHLKVELIPVWESVSTSNHTFERVIWDKLPKCIFGNFGIVQVKRRQLQNF